MNEQMPEFIIPRDEKETCGLFEDFLFMNIAGSSEFSNTEEDAKFKLNKKDLQLLYDTGIINRVFRRWFQTNWGYNDWSRFFGGETPRQELSHYYSDFKKGNAMLSVEMKQVDKLCNIIPRLTTKQDIPSGYGMYTYGLNNIKKRNFAPSFDLGFSDFSKSMYEIEKAAKSLKSYNTPENEEEKWCKLFWSQAGASLVFNIKLELSKNKLIKLAYEFQSCISYFVENQGEGVGDFIEVDDLIENFWHILRNVDSRLEVYSEMINKNKDNISKKAGEINYVYSVRTFYLLGHLLDEKILFPMDVYFGGIECVWTDKEHFIGTMLETTMLLKNNLNNSNYYSKLTKEEREQVDYIGIVNIVMNIKRTWFSPPTVFRVLPSVKKYF